MEQEILCYIYRSNNKYGFLAMEHIVRKVFFSKLPPDLPIFVPMKKLKEDVRDFVCISISPKMHGISLEQK